MISLFDMFKIGIGPSSSHTMGPMVAAGMFIDDIKKEFNLEEINRVQVDLYGSLAATGRGHATDTACILGLLGFKADKIDTTKVPDYLAPIFDYKRLNLNHTHVIDFNYDKDIVWHIQKSLPHHPNGLSFTGYTKDGNSITRTYYSIGGGFVATEDEFDDTPEDLANEARDKTGNDAAHSELVLEDNATAKNSQQGDLNNDSKDDLKDDLKNKMPSVSTRQKDTESGDKVAITSDLNIPYPFNNSDELLAQCEKHNLSISQVMMANELTLRDADTINAYLDSIWDVMQECVKNGCKGDGILPGGLKVRRRAKSLHEELIQESKDSSTDDDKLMAMDWVDLYALAVNEENANGGRVVTAPTNGAAGIIPAVMHYYRDFLPSFSIEGAREFLLVATAIGTIIKQNASISGAEVGCQGEVGSACAMAAAGLAHVLGLSPAQCTNAAEIGIEHNLGLTCDPIGGLVQVPCIERNAMAAVKAINAARLAKRGDGTHLVSLDNAIATMKATGADMMDKYKETAMGGLAIQVFQNHMNIGDETTIDANNPDRIDVVEVAVGYPQC